MTFPRLLMEDHCHAYSFWKEKGFKDGICIHVDAHLDLMDRGFTPEMLKKIATVKCAEDLKDHHTPSFLPWGGVHCGNYLYPALLEGVVTHLVWVVPKKMVAEAGSLLDFSQEELLNWMELTLEEHESLRQEGPRVEGTLAGRRFTLCTSEHLPELDDRPVLLDIDVDYFQDSDDQIWQTPGELYREMELKRIDALTTAVSVDGGYTCLEHRYLGEVVEEVFSDGPSSSWEARTLEVLEADRAREADPEAYGGLGREDDPAWFKAALTLKQNLARGQCVKEACEPAAAIDARYQALDMNQALCHLRAGRVDEALALTGDSPGELFVRAIIAFQSGRFEISKELWDTFLAKTELNAKERAFALFIRGQAVVQSSTPAEGLSDLSEALKLDPSNYQYALFCGLVLQITGDFKKAAKVWRKALSSYGDRLASIGLHLELSRLYRVMGRAALANAELRRVAQKDTKGDYKMVIQLEHLRSKKLTPTIPKPCLTGVWAGTVGVGGLR